MDDSEFYLVEASDFAQQVTVIVSSLFNQSSYREMVLTRHDDAGKRNRNEATNAHDVETVAGVSKAAGEWQKGNYAHHHNHNHNHNHNLPK
jgi:hypothetical protein